MPKSNADRQKAYRDRKRNARNAAVGPILDSKPTHTGKDIDLPNGDQLIYLGDWGYGPQYARVLNHRDAAE